MELIGGGPSQKTRLGKKGTTFAFSAYVSAIATVVYLFIYLFRRQVKEIQSLLSNICQQVANQHTHLNARHVRP